jgi:hypothetical protein
VTIVHLGFMGWSVLTAHYPALFLGGFLIFLGFAKAMPPRPRRVRRWRITDPVRRVLPTGAMRRPSSRAAKRYRSSSVTAGATQVCNLVSPRV